MYSKDKEEDTETRHVGSARDNNPTSLFGQACKPGYQSHYLEATLSGQPAINVADRWR